MTDPFLLAHQAGPMFFDLSGKLVPISIRDQMVRGRLLVDRALEQKLIGPDAPLLVIGGGACGITAAIRAADQQVRTLLIDELPPFQGAIDAFRLQYHCTTRWIDPTLYEWPADHWDKGIFTWAGTTMPLPWSAERAKVVATRWRASLATEKARLKATLDVWEDTRIAWPPALHNHRLHVLLDRAGAEIKKVVAMVIVAVGAGDEKVFDHKGPPPRPPGTYRGFGFWQDDPFEQDGCGLGSKQDTVLISGSGEGALQDFLRITTRKASAKEVLGGCFDGPSQVNPATTQPIKEAIQGAETRARGAMHWGRGGRYDHDYQQELENVHMAQVRLALADSELQSNLQESASEPA